MQHDVEIFLNSKTGYSLERDVKISRRELNDDHHHHLNTPILEGMWVFLDILVSPLPLGCLLTHTEGNFLFHSNSGGNTLRDLEIISR